MSLLDEACEIAVKSMVRNTRHRQALFHAVNITASQRDFKRFGNACGIFSIGFKKIADPYQEDDAGAFCLELHVLPQHRGELFNRDFCHMG